MKARNTGFTLVEIAIVLVIIGLLLGGVLKGQELINSAKVKNLSQDFRTIPLFIYGYQDKFRALPGDDLRAQTHLCPASACTTNGNGNGRIDGNWDDAVSATPSEAVLFWQHVRLANLAGGSTVTTDPNYLPLNADGGRIGVQGGGAGAPLGVAGSHVVCSAGISGKYIRQLDAALDDGDPETGSMRAGSLVGTTLTAVSPTNPLDEATPYVACLGF
ncbi:MAG: prepilin-type N-terminal cleavage/methylation domain-containing protein [Azoarcus sp.]|nr:prepilin-type N-terminal cleavage/methylation domain-containing protein [Azoarcus sp.]